MTDRKRKQHYLRDEILSQGFQGEDFEEFCLGLRPDGSGTDLDTWTFEEIKIIVRDFKASMQIKQSPQQQVYQQPVSLPPQQPDYSTYNQQQQQSTIATSNYQSPPPSQEYSQPPADSSYSGFDYLTMPDENFTEAISCNRPQPLIEITPDQQIDISIKDYQVKKGGLLSGSYTVFTITTPSFGWEVQKRYSEIAWLHTSLKRMYPGLALPPVSPKKYKNKSEILFKKRMRFLDRMFKSIMKSQELRNLKLVQEFLSLSTSDFKSKIKVYDKMSKQENLSQYENYSGQIKTEISQQVNVYNEASQDFVNICDLQYKKIRRLAKQLMIEFDNTSKISYRLSETFMQLMNQSQQLQENFQPFTQNFTLPVQYQKLAILLDSYKKYCDEEINIFDEHFKSFLKYQNHEAKALKELQKPKNDSKLNYFKSKQNLLSNKERLFVRGEHTKWELSPEVTFNCMTNKQQAIQQYDPSMLVNNKALAYSVMLPKQTEQVMQHKAIYAFYNFQHSQEMTRVLDQKSINYFENTAELAQKHSINLIKTQEICQNVASQQGLINFSLQPEKPSSQILESNQK